MKESLGIAGVKDERDLYYQALHLEDDGRLVIEGHDLGSGVGEGWVMDRESTGSFVT